MKMINSGPVSARRPIWVQLPRLQVMLCFDGFEPARLKPALLEGLQAIDEGRSVVLNLLYLLLPSKNFKFNGNFNM